MNNYRVKDKIEEEIENVLMAMEVRETLDETYKLYTEVLINLLSIRQMLQPETPKWAV